jgi:hypothetical protein
MVAQEVGLELSDSLTWRVERLTASRSLMDHFRHFAISSGIGIVEGTHGAPPSRSATRQQTGPEGKVVVGAQIGELTMTTTDPSEMTPEARCAEVASIFAGGYLRLASRPRALPSNAQDGAENAPDSPPNLALAQAGIPAGISRN